LRAVRRLATDGRIPLPLRWLAVAGLLPVPGPVDEAILLLAAALLALFYRDLMGEAWRETGEVGAASARGELARRERPVDRPPADAATKTHP
jgi:hypothetical protein